MSAGLLKGSGDPLADRRLDYARALLEEGDAAASADLAHQALELAPLWPAAWFLLGEAEEKADRRSEAAAAFGRCAALDPADTLGAGLRLSLLAGKTPPAMSPAYVGTLFDQYAHRFDATLTGRLDYRGPEVLADALARACATIGRPLHFRRALDLGCGTGLAGAALRENIDWLSGVDLSAEMVRIAQAKGIYDALRVGDVMDALAAAQPDGIDLVIAADVFVYLGDLFPVIAAAARGLVPRGLLAFTAEKLDGADPAFALGEKLRYAHGAAHLRAAAESAYLQAVLVEDCSTRREAGIPVPGLIAVFAKP